MQLVNQTQTVAPLMRDALLSRKETARRTSLSASSIAAMAKAGLFPRPVPLTPSGSRVAWLESQVNAWIQERAEQAADAVRAKGPRSSERATQ